MDNLKNKYVAYLKLNNGQDIISIVFQELYFWTLTLPTIIVPDYDGVIDPADLYLEDWLPAAKLKTIDINKDKILDVKELTQEARESYNTFIETTKPKSSNPAVRPNPKGVSVIDFRQTQL